MIHGRPPRTRRLVDGNYDRSRSVRIPDDVWDGLHSKAHRQDITGSYVVAVLAQQYVLGLVSISAVDTNGGRSRSIRISDEVYEAFRELTKATGLTTSGALATLARMYADDEIELRISVTAFQRFP